MLYDDVCAVIVTRGDQPETVARIVADLPYGEVIVWDNSQQDTDLKVFGRYAAANRTKRPVVYFQDDDIIFREHEGLTDRYEPGVLVSNMNDEWIDGCGYYDLAMVGLGSIMDKNLWSEYFWRYREAYRDDRFLFDPDFIFGTLATWKRIDFGAEILDVASADNRLWKQPEQFDGKWRTINRARALRQVVLTIMAKDEEQNIRRALESAHGWYDKVLLMDTGSTDGTVAVVEAFCGAQDIPLEVLDMPFEDFGTNRNALLARGRELADYQLLMDADEELVFREDGAWGEPEIERARPQLTADAYLLHYEGEIDYAQPRLLFKNFPWKFDDVSVHASLDVDSQTLTPRGHNLREPLIRHHGDLRHGMTKVQRDIDLLTQEIENGNDLPRHLFLRAKAYEGVGNNDAALADYAARVELSRGDEEAYYSRFRLGVLTGEHLNDFPEAVRQLLAAWEERPSRIESLRALAFYATAIADATPYPEEDLVLVHRDLYNSHKE